MVMVTLFAVSNPTTAIACLFNVSCLLLFLVSLTIPCCDGLQTGGVALLYVDEDTMLSEEEKDTNGGNNELLEISQSSRVLLNFEDFDFEVEHILSATIQLFVVETSRRGYINAFPLIEGFDEGNGVNYPLDSVVLGSGEGATWNCWRSDLDISNTVTECDPQKSPQQVGGEWGEATASEAVFHSNDDDSDDDQIIEFDVLDDIKSGAKGWLIKFSDEQEEDCIDRSSQCSSTSLLIWSKEGSSKFSSKLELRVMNMDFVFDPNFVRDWNIEISQQNYETLLETASEEEYVECGIELDGFLFEGVGCRFKGDDSNLYECLRNIDLPLRDATSSNCRSLSWKLDSNKFREDSQRFFGLKKLQFHSMNSNLNYIAERMAYEMFGEVDIIAPRAVHANLFLNDELYGLMLLVEQVDEVFIEDRFGYDMSDGHGALYKESFWNPLDADYYDEFLLEDGPPSGDLWVDFAIYADSQHERIDNEVEARRLLSEFVNVEALEKYSAMLMILNNHGEFHSVFCADGCEGEFLDPDGHEVPTLTGDPRYWHNFYFYLEETDEIRFYIIPWDFDAAFADRNRFDSPHWTVLPDEPTGNCEPTGGETRGSEIHFGFSCDPAGWMIALGTRAAMPELVKQYTDIFDDNWFRERTEEIESQIRDHVRNDPLTDSYREWKVLVEDFIDIYAGRNGHRDMVRDFVDDMWDYFIDPFAGG